MAKSHVVEIGGRDALVDPLTEILRPSPEQPIYQSVEEELARGVGQAFRETFNPW